MRFSQVLAKAQTATGPRAPFKRSGTSFDTLFVEPQRGRKKAWEGQDKDAFFRDKYAHVHAKQLQRRREEQELKKQRLQAKGGAKKSSIVSPAPVPPPRADFARRLADRLARNPQLEYIYGTNAVRAVLNSRKCHKLFTGVCSVADVEPDLLALCRDNEVPVETRVPAQHLQIMAAQGVHNKYVIEVDKRNVERLDSLDVVDGHSLLVNGERHIPLNAAAGSGSRAFKPALGLFIDQVTDTHNMGALLRSAQFFGVDFVAISARNSAPISPAVVKASSGAAEFVPILESAKPLRLFDELRERGWAIVATGPSPASLAQVAQSGTTLHSIAPESLRTLTSPTLLVVGSEGDGIRTSLLQRSTHETTLPTHQQQIDSLNVSVASAVLLHSITA